MLLGLCLALPACGQASSDATAMLRPGDLLFQETDGHALGEAIKAVTEGVDGAKFTHVGIVATAGDLSTVVEAGGKGVKVTPLAAFLARSKDDHGRPKVVVGRLKAQFRSAAEPSVKRALALVGTPYNDEFLLDNGKYYCSQLVYECFRDGSGKRLFEVFPMTFRAPGATQPVKAWQDYFDKKGKPIPEGKPGCNPGALSRSANIEIIHAFGKPTGWTEEEYLRHIRPMPR
ncbi:MAG: YiiX/YebB-like N1pC/P60 family cysteine hydrolase [Phycisphaerae bacterium]